MDKFEEYFRTTKQYQDMLLEIARNQISASVFDKRGKKYRNHIVQTAYEVFKHQQAKVEELQEEFAEDERFLKEQIQQKDLEISNLKYLQGMDKDLIQTLQGRSSALQDKVNDLQKQANELQNDVSIMLNSHKRMSAGLLQQQDKIEKLTKERDELQNLYTQQGINMLELQKRVEAALLEIKGAARWIEEDAIDDADFIKGGALRALKRLEQALKGGGK